MCAMEACSSEQSVWAQRKGWGELELTFQVKKEKQTNKKFLWPLFPYCTEQSAIRWDCCWYSRLLLLSGHPACAMEIQDPKGNGCFAPSPLAHTWECCAQCCTGRLCSCSYESNATKKDSQHCQTATSGHETIS